MRMNEKIKQLRSEKGLTLEEVGNFVGVGKSTVRKWENGMIENMRSDKIARLATVLGTTPAYLMGWDDESDEEFIKSIGELKPLEELPDELKPLNAMLYSIGEQLTCIEGNIYLGECGLLSNEEIEFLKTSAQTSLKVAYDVIRNKKLKEMFDAINGKKDK